MLLDSQFTALLNFDLDFILMILNLVANGPRERTLQLC